MEKIAIIGLGYVGLPLAVEFGKIRNVIGFDINESRIKELMEGLDCTKEVERDELNEAEHLLFTFNPVELSEASTYIVTVPTPIDEFKKPDLRPLISASRTVGEYIEKGDVVIFESTVYPGCTEEICIPELENRSGLKYNVDFFCGYSPERINPGDKEHRLVNIKKVTSGSTPEVAEKVNELYRSIIQAGTHKASSIKVAEASKVIENSQRDLNIAFVNELAIIFNKLGIDTNEVLEAAGTKWNFLPFRPGLVGGHCIGVDPYYLTYKAEAIGHHPEVILAGRRINDQMGIYIANEVVKLINSKGGPIKGTRVLVLGITFKENCADIRNTRVIDIIRELEDFGIEVDVHDPLANDIDVLNEYSIRMVGLFDEKYDGVILAVAHDAFMKYDLNTLITNKGIIYDVKGKIQLSKFINRL